VSMVWIGTSGNLTSTTTEVIFSSIPQTFTHLQVRCFAKSAFAGVAWLYMSINGSGSYISHSLRGDGSSTSSFSDGASALGFMSVGSTPSIFGVAIIDILDYANTNKNKTLRSLGGVDLNGSGELYFNSGLWMNTAAINNIVLTPIGTLQQYSSFALYGIK